jgi:uncharacterized protein (TIGR01244 family)
MKNEAVIDGVVVAGQLSDDEIRGLPGRGFGTLVNVRMPSELPEPERPKAEAAGLVYTEVPFTGDTLVFDDVRSVRDALAAGKGRAVVHCMAGTRASVVTAIVASERANEGADGALRRAAEAGFDLGGTPYVDFIARYFAATKP